MEKKKKVKIVRGTLRPGVKASCLGPGPHTAPSLTRGPGSEVPVRLGTPEPPGSPSHCGGTHKNKACIESRGGPLFARSIRSVCDQPNQKALAGVLPSPPPHSRPFVRSLGSSVARGRFSCTSRRWAKRELGTHRLLPGRSSLTAGATSSAELFRRACIAEVVVRGSAALRGPP